MLAQQPICTEFPVGSPEWTDCVESAATGGGLMPWIVIIPLGVMVLGMAYMFTAGHRKARDPIAVGGSWLLFMVLIEGSVAAGMTYAAIKAPGAGGGFFIAAVILWIVTGGMLIGGLAMRGRAGKRRRILEQGVAGTATITGMTQTGMFINNNPVVELQADIESPLGQYPATFKQMVPLISLGQLKIGAKAAVKIDPNDQNAIVLEGWAATADEDAGEELEEI